MALSAVTLIRSCINLSYFFRLDLIWKEGKLISFTANMFALFIVCSLMNVDGILFSIETFIINLSIFVSHNTYFFCSNPLISDIKFISPVFLLFAFASNTFVYIIFFNLSEYFALDVLFLFSKWVKPFKYVDSYVWSEYCHISHDVHLYWNTSAYDLFALFCEYIWDLIRLITITVSKYNYNAPHLKKILKIW